MWREDIAIEMIVSKIKQLRIIIDIGSNKDILLQ